MAENSFSTQNIVSIVIAFLMIAILIPIGLDQLFAMVLPEGVDPAIETLLMVVLPIMAVLGVVLGFIPKMKK